MHTSSFLVDTDQNMFVCGRFLLPSHIHQSIIYACHPKYLNIVNVKLRQFTKVYEYLNSAFRNVRRDIFCLYTFTMYICWYISCLLYVYSFSLISNISIVLLKIIDFLCVFFLFYYMQYLCYDQKLCMLNVKINLCSVLFCSVNLSAVIFQRVYMMEGEWSETWTERRASLAQPSAENRENTLIKISYQDRSRKVSQWICFLFIVNVLA